MTHYLKYKKNKGIVSIQVPNNTNNSSGNYEGKIDDAQDIVITVSISNKKGESYEKGSGCHTMMLYRNKKNPAKNIMVDADGSYADRWGRTNSSPVLEYTDKIPLILNRYVHYFDNNKPETLHIYTLASSTDNILTLKNCMKQASFYLPLVSCAATASAVMEESQLFENFRQTCFPKNVKKYLDNYSGCNFKITHSTYNFEKPAQKDFGDYY